MKYDTSSLIIAIKRNASLPTSQIRFTNTDFLSFLNEELQLTIVGELLNLRQDYFVTTINTSLVASQDSYSIPTSAVGWKLESVGYLDSSSNYTRLPMITRDQRGYYDCLNDSTAPSAVYVMDDKIYCVPDIGTSASGSLQFDLVRIQNELVLPSSTGKISSVADTGTVYQMTVDSSPIATGASCDVISGTNPFNIIARNVTGTVASNVVSVTYGTSFSRAPVANDYVCKTGESCIPNIPEDFHPVLAMAATVRCAIAINDKAAIETLSLGLSNMIKRMRDSASKRISDAPKKIVGNNYLLDIGRRRL